MTVVKDIYDFIDKIAPFDTKMDFDNVGILIGDKNALVKKCIVTLDISSKVIDEAIQKDANLIVSHHPIIFNPLKNLMCDSLPYLLVANNINVICAHTNLDIADKVGVNICLGNILKLKNIKPLSAKNNSNIVLKGTLEKRYNSSEFAKYVKHCLNCKAIKYVSSNKKINTVGFCCGAGGEFLKDAIKHKVDAYVSSDIKHHEFLMAKEANITLIDAGHFATEDIAMPNLAKLLSDRFNNVHFEKSQVNKDIIDYLL